MEGLGITDRRGKKGGSFIELLITLALFGLVLVSTSFPAQLLFSETQLRSVTYSLIDTLDHHSRAAIRRSQKVSLEFDIAKNTVRSDLKRSPTAGREETFKLPETVHFSRVRFGTVTGPSGAVTLSLNPDGSASPGTITLANDIGASCTITQALRGARRVQCS